MLDQTEDPHMKAVLLPHCVAPASLPLDMEAPFPTAMTIKNQRTAPAGCDRRSIKATTLVHTVGSQEYTHTHISRVWDYCLHHLRTWRFSSHPSWQRIALMGQTKDPCKPISCFLQRPARCTYKAIQVGQEGNVPSFIICLQQLFWGDILLLYMEVPLVIRANMILLAVPLQRSPISFTVPISCSQEKPHKQGIGCLPPPPQTCCLCTNVLSSNCG